VYSWFRQHSEPTSDKRGAKVDELTLTPLKQIDRIAALVPRPRTHRHRYFGVLAPNAPLRDTATNPARACTTQTRLIAFITHSADIGQIRCIAHLQFASLKPDETCEPSQNGLLPDAPQRHSVTRFRTS